MTEILNKRYSKGSSNLTIRLTNFISLTLFLMMILTGLLFYTFEINTRVTMLTWVLSPFVLSPYILNRLGFINISKIILPIILPIIITFLSIDGKVHLMIANDLSAISYFDMRLILLSSALIPLVTFNFSQKTWLAIAYIPSTISILLYDPIHNFFNVGYYQAGLQDSDYYFLANLFTSITFIFITSVILSLNYQVYKNEKWQTTENKKLNTYLSELVRLSNSYAISHGKVEESKIEIIKAIRDCMNVSRVSIWNYNHEAESIECKHLIGKNGIESSEIELLADNHPKYINAIKKETLIIAQNAEENIYTSGIAEEYLKPFDIKSIMNAPYLSKGEVQGIICCEQQHTIKNWGPAESILLKGIADLLTYALLIDEREHQNQLLKEKNIEISDINKGLETTIGERTKELQEKNTQLTEYAYINSHILRAPVARISGLYNLFLMETKNALDNSNILNHMDTTITELEDVTKQINRAIESHGTVDRDKISGKL